MSDVEGSQWDADVLGLLMASMTGTSVPDWLEEPLREGLGAVILFGHNTPDPTTARDLARSLHAIAPEVLVAIDEEGGDVSRLQAATGSGLPSAWALGVVDDVSLSHRTGQALGGLLAACDLDLDLAPVLDVSTDPANPVIGTRAFGADPDRVTRHGRAVTSGLREAGVGSCGKHFPGHGATAVDSHTGLPVIELSRAAIDRDHLEPWQLAPWLDAVMTAHVLVPALGEGPASLGTWTRPLLDHVCQGRFHGLIITDALDMAAVSDDPGFGEAAVRALEAGAHLLCLGTSIRRGDLPMLREAHDAVLAAIRSGRLPRDEIVRRVAETRAGAHALRERRRWVPAPPLDEALEAVEVCGAEAARRAVRARHARLGGGPVAVVDARARRDHAAGPRPTGLVESLASHGITAHPVEYAPADLPVSGDLLVITRLPRADPAEGAMLREVLAARPDAIVVHVGVPRAAPDHDRIVLTLGTGRSMVRAAVDLLIDSGGGQR